MCLNIVMQVLKYKLVVAICTTNEAGILKVSTLKEGTGTDAAAAPHCCSPPPRRGPPLPRPALMSPARPTAA